MVLYNMKGQVPWLGRSLQVVQVGLAYEHLERLDLKVTTS